MTIVISAFPATGKTYYYKNHPKNISVIDSDSSDFSWIEAGVRNPDFPRNYIDHILMKIGCVDVILVSSHKVVRDALLENDIKFTKAYPMRNLKWVYLYRLYDRGSPDSFIQMMYENWDTFIDEMENCPTNGFLLGETSYLSTFLDEILSK